jgi:sugar lactone lactonase YvrE
LFIDNNPALVNPNALARGPEGNMLYVGTVGHVWRIPLVDGGGAGEPQDYLDLGDDTGETYEVDGLIFDEGGNIWVGCPNAGTLYVAHYSAKGPTEISRTFDTAAANLSGFVSLRFGNNDFDERSLYYTNLAEGTVGRLRVGLDAL